MSILREAFALVSWVVRSNSVSHSLNSMHRFLGRSAGRLTDRVL
ncbi:hypothetical protein [Leptospira noguchii]|nr:hypothetical protein [Leptospira noguchii]